MLEVTNTKMLVVDHELQDRFNLFEKTHNATLSTAFVLILCLGRGQGEKEELSGGYYSFHEL